MSHINATVQSVDDGPTWKLTCFYGHLETNRKREAWSLLWLLASFAPKPWMVVSDFNEILDSSEKKGGLVRARGLMEAFQAALVSCELNDLGVRGL